jgi:RNA polymerase sigma factor (sigma-70 family)
MAKSKKMIEIDDLVEQYQIEKDEQMINKLYDKIKGYIHSRARTVDEISDANYTFARAVDTWKKSSNVFFITWFKRLWIQQDMERVSYYTRKKRSGNKTIPLDAQVNHDSKLQVSETIPDEREPIEQRRIENQKRFIDFIEANVESERERMILENIYLDKGKFQTEIAKQMGISQAMVHKSIRSIHKRPYADELKSLLKELMSND